MQKALFYLVLMLNSSTFATGNSTYHLQFFLGCQAVIPCETKRSDSNSFKWFYKKNERSKKIQIFSENKNGIKHHNVFRPKGSVSHDRALVIDCVTEDDQGLYWCEYCNEGICNSDHPTAIRVTKEILTESLETVYVAAGSDFTHSCPGGFTNFKWTFEASNARALSNSAVKTETNVVSFSKSIHIVNVKRADAGIYICWTSNCAGQSHKMLTVNLCVITAQQSGNVSCAVMCDVEISNDATFNCSTVNSTHTTLNTSRIATDANPQPGYLTPLVYGTSAVLTCLIVMMLVIYFRSRFCAAFSDSPSDARVEEDSVVYSSVVYREPAKTTTSFRNDSECVYSDIKI